MHKQIDLIIALLIAVLLAALTGAVVWIIQEGMCDNKVELSRELSANLIAENKTESDSQLQESDSIASDSSASLSKSKDEERTNSMTNETESWTTFSSYRYNYEIKFPPAKNSDEAIIQKTEETSFSDKDDYEEYTGEVCVSINTAYGNVGISAPPNKDYEYVICGMTGMGNEYEVTSYTENIVIDGKTYECGITDMKNDKAHKVYGRVYLEDDTHINFSSSYDDKEKMKEVISTYRKTN